MAVPPPSSKDARPSCATILQNPVHLPPWVREPGEGECVVTAYYPEKNCTKIAVVPANNVDFWFKVAESRDRMGTSEEIRARTAGASLRCLEECKRILEGNGSRKAGGVF